MEDSIQQASTGKYWDGSGFNSATEVINLASGTTSWTYGFTPPADDSYTVHARASDSSSVIVCREP